jgi:hypothetical protein
MTTSEQYDEIIERCRNIFLNKLNDYGLSWKTLRPTSITDQIFIKANRIRNLEEKKVSKIQEGVDVEYIGMINYSVIALIQILYNNSTSENVVSIYNSELSKAKELMMNKNHDYDEIWRKMRISSLTDIILQKLLRIKQIEDNKGLTKSSEGLESNYQDIINYSVFALIRLSEEKCSNDQENLLSTA